MTVTVGDIVDGVVTGITKFGAFVKLEDSTVGLVHISEVADVYVKEIADFLKEQDTVKVKVISVDKQKVGLSIKQAVEKTTPPPRQNNYKEQRHFSNKEFADDGFESKLAKFMKDSNDKLVALKRHQEGRKGR